MNVIRTPRLPTGKATTLTKEQVDSTYWQARCKGHFYRPGKLGEGPISYIEWRAREYKRLGLSDADIPKAHR